MVDVILEHLEDHFEAGILLVHHDHRLAHHLGDRQIPGEALGHHLGAQVRVREDADGPAAPADDQGRTLAFLGHALGRLADAGARRHHGAGVPADLPHGGGEEQVVAAAQEETLALDFPGGHVQVLGEMELEQILGDGRVAGGQLREPRLGQQVADGVLHRHDGGPLGAAHQGDQTEDFPLLAVVDDHVLGARRLGPLGDLHHPLLDDVQVLRQGPILLEDGRAPRVELQGEALRQFPQQGRLQELEGRDLGQEPDRLVDQHRASSSAGTMGTGLSLSSQR